MKNTVAIAMVLSAVAVYAAPSSAGLLVKQFDGNDCTGASSNDTVYSSNGFQNCGIWAGDELVSPVIAKYEFEGEDDLKLDSVEIGAEYPDFDTSLIDIEFDENNVDSGEWSYNQGANDPGIRFWIAKGGNDFNLFWAIDEADDAKCDDLLSFACLDAAQTMTSGNWYTPNDTGLSHMTFFNSAYIPVPEPGSLALLGLGLIGLRFARRSSKAA